MEVKREAIPAAFIHMKTIDKSCLMGTKGRPTPEQASRRDEEEYHWHANKTTRCQQQTIRKDSIGQQIVGVRRVREWERCMRRSGSNMKAIK